MFLLSLQLLCVPTNTDMCSCSCFCTYDFSITETKVELHLTQKQHVMTGQFTWCADTRHFCLALIGGSWRPHCGHHGDGWNMRKSTIIIKPEEQRGRKGWTGKRICHSCPHPLSKSHSCRVFWFCLSFSATAPNTSTIQGTWQKKISN